MLYQLDIALKIGYVTVLHDITQQHYSQFNLIVDQNIESRSER